jgi:hypothetical protein
MLDRRGVLSAVFVAGCSGSQPIRTTAGQGEAARSAIVGAGVRGEVRAGTSEQRGRGEAYWRAEAQQRREAVTVAEREAGAAERAGKGFIYPPDSAERLSEFSEGQAAAQARVVRAQAALHAARQRLSDLDDDARRDHALPGRVR